MPPRRKQKNIPPAHWVLRGLRVPLEDKDGSPRAWAARHLGLPEAQIREARVVRRSVDARHGRVCFELSLRLVLENPPRRRLPELQPVLPEKPLPAPPPARRPKARVAVVGTGPAGLFAAWRLSLAGLQPLVIERGPAFPERHQDVAELLAKGQLNPDSNLHFGLGGAGTYSDGKLYTRLHEPGVQAVLETFQRLGAGSPDEILIAAHPHVGTDRWPRVLEAFQAMLVSQGVGFRFHTRVDGVKIRAQHLSAVLTSADEIEAEAAILAPGNSARELFQALHLVGIALRSKPFALGVRLSHPQALIDRIQYGRAAGHPDLPPASYRLAGTFAGRGVFSFCMCPGGQIVPTPTEPERLCLNGMSPSARDTGEANAALVAGVTSADFEDPEDPLAGIELQRRLEAAAYRAGGGGYRAPAQSLQDFLASGPAGAQLPVCNYRPGLTPADVTALLPTPVLASLQQGIRAFGQKLCGFVDPQALVLGLETRTSCPVRILRGEDGMSPSLAGLFPAGEGAGYAGGIVSSALDGIRAADALLHWLR